MKKILSYVVLMLTVLLITSCDDESWNPEDLVNDKGELLLSSLNVELEVNEMHTGIISDYIVSILNSDSQEVARWKYAEMPETMSLLAGDYTVEVKSHELKDAEWDKPYYYGKQSFKIEKSVKTELDNVTCRFSNVMVSVVYDDALAAVLGEDVKVSVSVGTGSLEYIYGEQRIGYFALPEGSRTLVAVFSGKVNGIDVSLVKTYTDVEAGKHCKVVFTLDDVNKAGGEKDPNAPTIESETLNLDGANVIIPGLIAKVDINAPYGVESLVVEIISETLNAEVLTEVGLAAKFDLAHPGELEEVLMELGFPTGDNVKGKTYLPFDITMFMELLAAFPGTHQFRLTVTDTVGLEAMATLTFLAESAPNAPTIESETLDLDGTNVITPELVAKVDINVPNGVESLVVEIISETLNAEVLTEVGLAAKFDLAHPGELEDVLMALGFPTGDNVKGKTYLPFDITMFMELLAAFPGTHQFRLTVTDVEGLDATATLSFLVE